MTQYLYHYTNQVGLDDIFKTRFIRSSKKNDTLFGEGVYLSDLSPSSGEEAILFNNYGKYRKRNTNDKAICYFKFKRNQLKGAYCRTLKDGRIIWRYPKNSICIDTIWFDYGYTNPARSPMKKRQHADCTRVKKEKIVPSAKRLKTSQPSSEVEVVICKKKDHQFESKIEVEPTQNADTHQIVNFVDFKTCNEFYRSVNCAGCDYCNTDYSSNVPPPKTHYRQPESNGYGRLITIGSIAVIGFGLMKLFWRS